MVLLVWPRIYSEMNGNVRTGSVFRGWILRLLESVAAVEFAGHSAAALRSGREILRIMKRYASEEAMQVPPG